jgi:DNA-directed RNA polymerase beta subunit
MDLQKKILRLFYRDNSLVKHQIDSFDIFVQHMIPLIIKQTETSPISVETDKDEKSKCSVTFHNPFLMPPKTLRDGKMINITPMEARLASMDYSAPLIVEMIKKTEYIEEKRIEETKENIILCWLPILVGSSFCVSKYEKKKECEYDLGGYFIINGSEKVLISQERMAYNQPFVFAPKKSRLSAEIKSMDMSGRKIPVSFKINYIFSSKRVNEVIVASLPYIKKDIPLIYIFRALGITNDLDIVECIADLDYLGKNPKVANIIRLILEEGNNTVLIEKKRQLDEEMNLTKDDEKKSELKTRIEYLPVEQALEMIGKNSSTFLATKEKKVNIARSILETELLPHIGITENSFRDKAKFIGYMTMKLINAIVTEEYDDRDYFMNKRVDTTGYLFGSLFNQAFNKFCKECCIFIKKKFTKKTIESDIITKLLKYSLSTGNWGINKTANNRTGVSQVLSRFNFNAYISHERRITTPITKNGASVKPRQLHNSQWGICCPVESPEGSSCLVMSSMIMFSNSESAMIKSIQDVDVSSIKVKSVNPITLIEEDTNIRNVFTVNNKNLIKITTISGRVLKCTLDHPLLTNNGWVNAGDLKVKDIVVVHPYSDQIFVSSNTKYKLFDDISLENFRDKLAKLTTPRISKTHCKLLKKLETIDEETYCILARLCGYINTNGHCHVGKQMSIDVYLERPEDADKVCKEFGILKRKMFGETCDILNKKYKVSEMTVKTTGRKYTIHMWNVRIDGALVSLFVFLGIRCVKKILSDLTVPKWCFLSKKILGEYLGGIFGGDGNKIGIHKRIDHAGFTFQSPKIIQSKVSRNDSYFKDIETALLEFDIESKISCKKKNDRFEYEISISSSLKNLNNFIHKIGYRYAFTKNSSIIKIIEYLKYVDYQIEKVKNFRKQLCELHDRGLGPKKISKLLNARDRLVRSVLEMKKLNKLNVPTKLRNSLSFDKFMEKYPIIENSQLIEIESIEKIPSEPVMDFTTISDNHSFVANGFITHNCGLVKNISLACHISNFFDPSFIIEYIDSFKSEDSSSKYKIIVNGKWVNECPISELYPKLVSMKRNGIVAFDVSISININKKQLQIFTDSGRMCRPLLIVENGKLNITEDIEKKISDGTIGWGDLLLEQAIEYLDPAEQENSMIASNINELTNQKSDSYSAFTHCELDASLIMGACASCIPFSNHNQSPRNVYNTSMAKQAIGVSGTNFEQRMDTLSHVMWYPQKQLVSTDSSDYLNYDKIPVGQNVIVAICLYTGQNIDDAVIVNQSALDRGLFRSYFYRTFKEQEFKSATCDEKFHKDIKNFKLDNDGLGQVGVRVVDDDCIIGKFDTKTNKETPPTRIKHGEGGIIDKVMITNGKDGTRMTKIRIRNMRGLELGYKISSHHAQKNTLGMAYRQEDMPFDPLSGMVPDVIINSHCIIGSTIIWSSQGPMYIKDITPNIYIRSLNIQTMQFEFIKPRNIFKKFSSNIIELKTWSGDTIKCTKDHKLMVYKNNKFIWKEAKNIIPNIDKIAMKHAISTILSDDKRLPSISPIDPYKEQLEKLGYVGKLSLEKTKILAKMLGALVTGGRLTKLGHDLYKANFYFQEEIDVEEFMIDVSKLGFKAIKKRRKSMWSASLDHLASYLLFYLGANYKKRIETPEIPEWLKNSSLSVKREFLSGFQGQTRFCVYHDNGQIIEYQTRVANQNRYFARKYKYLNENIKCLREISIMFGELGINTIIHQETKNITTENGIRNVVDLILEVVKNVENAERYFDTIDCSYCNSKRYYSCPLIFFNKMMKQGYTFTWEQFLEQFCIMSSDVCLMYVKSIDEAKGEDVYDFEVPKLHNFVANSFVVHNCMPSRMTIAQLLEMITGKITSISGKFYKATAFSEPSFSSLTDSLSKLGFERHGNQVLCDGFTGKMMKSQVFMGPSFYHKLRHMSDDKIHMRARGQMQLLVRQPAEGRSRNGGLRLGEMEQSCIITHGMSYFLREKLFINSDNFSCSVCKKCGLIGPFPIDKEQVGEKIFCKNCQEIEVSTNIKLPYAAKLLIQELMACNISPRIKI